MALKQKSDIEHYRNKLRLKAKRKGYYDLPLAEGSSSSKAVSQRYQHGHQRAPHEHGRPLENDDERSSTYVKSHRRCVCMCVYVCANLPKPVLQRGVKNPGLWKRGLVEANSKRSEQTQAVAPSPWSPK